MSRPLGDYDEFAVECKIVQRDNGLCRETLTERLNRDEYALVQFVDEDDTKLVQADTPPGTADYVIDAELDFGPDYGGDSWSVAELIAKTLDNRGFRVIAEQGSERYYVVSEAESE